MAIYIFVPVHTFTLSQAIWSGLITFLVWAKNDLAIARSAMLVQALTLHLFFSFSPPFSASLILLFSSSKFFLLCYSFPLSRSLLCFLFFTFFPSFISPLSPALHYLLQWAEKSMPGLLQGYWELSERRQPQEWELPSQIHQVLSDTGGHKHMHMCMCAHRHRNKQTQTDTHT